MVSACIFYVLNGMYLLKSNIVKKYAKKNHWVYKNPRSEDDLILTGDKFLIRGGVTRRRPYKVFGGIFWTF